MLVNTVFYQGQSDFQAFYIKPKPETSRKKLKQYHFTKFIMCWNRKKNVSFIAEWLGISCLFLLSGCAKNKQAEQPNFLFILTDDQRYDAMGALGHPFLETPNLDRIRNEGVHLKNAFVTTSLCSPSRASILTGTYAHTHGVFNNNFTEFNPEKTPSYHEILRKEAGYQTAFIGKWHMDETTDEPRPGFDYWLSFKGQGLYFNPWINSNGERFQEEGYITDILTEYTIKWLKDERNKKQPFSLFVSHKAIHAPFAPAPRHAEKYENEIITAPPGYWDNLAGKPKWTRNNELRKKEYVSDEPMVIPDSVEIEEYKPQNFHKDYLRSILAVDEGVGRILDALEAIGELENTVIVFAGDNGFFLLEHGRDDKRIAWEESMRIPVVMRYPPLIKKGSTISEMILNQDFAPTFLDIAGVKIPDFIQGKSFVPLFKNHDIEWRKSFLYEYWVEYLPQIPHLLAVRTIRYKYITYPDLDDIDELYDLGKDPYELTNLASKPEYEPIIKKMKHKLDSLKEATNYRDEPIPDASDRPSGIIFSMDLSQKIEDQTVYSTRVKVIDSAGIKNQVFFDNQKLIAISGNEVLDPSNCNYGIDVTFTAMEDGVVLSSGNKDLGYTISVEEGIPVFTVRNGYSWYKAKGKQSCIGKNTNIKAFIELIKKDVYTTKSTLFVNNEKVAEIPQERIIFRNTGDIYLGGDPTEEINPRVKNFYTKATIYQIKFYRGNPHEFIKTAT